MRVTRIDHGMQPFYINKPAPRQKQVGKQVDEQKKREGRRNQVYVLVNGQSKVKAQYPEKQGPTKVHGSQVSRYQLCNGVLTTLCVQYAPTHLHTVQSTEYRVQ